MADNFFSIMAFLFVLINVLSRSALAGRDIAKTAAGGDDHKKLMQPESFVDMHDATVLVQGWGDTTCSQGRQELISIHLHIYNPVTGNSGGTGVGTGTTGGSRSYIPGADDTFIPNPGFEVPNPSGGGGITSPPAGRRR